MTPDDQYVLDCIKTWVWSGFYSAQQIESLIDDVVVPGCDVAFLKASVKSEVKKKLTAQDAWPAETDCDRLDKAVRHLHGAGICALQNAGYTMSDGREDVAEAVAGGPDYEGYYRGFCFYHGQDVERAVKGQGLDLAFGAIDNDSAAGVWSDAKLSKRFDRPASRRNGMVRSSGASQCRQFSGREDHRGNAPLPGVVAIAPQLRPRMNYPECRLDSISSIMTTGAADWDRSIRNRGFGQALTRLKAYMGAILVYRGNFFGMIDRFYKTVQFVVNPDGRVHIEFVMAERRGAMATTMALADVITLASKAGPSLATLSIPGATFKLW